MDKNDVNTIKYVYEDLKKVIMSCVIKYDNIGRKYETAESKRDFDHYFIASNKLDGFDSYPSFPKEVLIRSGIFDKEQLQDCLEDKLLIPYPLQKKVVEENRKYIIENYEEKNNYYRMLTGLPDIEDDDYIYLDKDTCIKYKVRIGTPIHKYYDYEINNISPLIPELIEKYPEKKYLNYLGNNKVDLLRARSAKNFDIIHMDLNFHTVLLKSFVDTYDMCREYFTSVIYIKEKNAKDDMYDNFIALNIMFMTVQRMFVNTFKMGVERDFYDLDSIKKLFNSYGIPFFETLPVDYQRMIMKRLNILLRAKSTDNCLYDIVDILFPSRANIFEYYLMKEQKYDENDLPMEAYKEETGIDGLPNYIEDSSKMYDIYFQTLDIKEVGVNMALENKPNRYEYHEVVDEDPQWWHDDDLIRVLDEREFNYIETKYLGINIMYHLTQMMFESVYFINMLADKKDDYHRPNDGFFLTIQLPRITTEPVSIFDSIVLLCALLCKKRHFAGNIINSGTKILTVMGFDFEENFDLIRQDIKKNKRIVDQSILKFLDLTTITSKEDINTVYNNMVNLAEFCVDGMNNTDDAKTYHAYKYLYDALMVKKYTKDIMTKSDGEVASTYLDYLWDQNPRLASFVESCNTEQCSMYIEHVLGILNELIPDLEYLSTINGTDNVLVTALTKMILFFKSYTVDLRNINVMYIMDSRRYNMIKLVKDLTLLVKMYPHERISFYIDLIHQLKSKIFYDEYVEPLERLILIAKILIKDKKNTKMWDKMYKTTRIIYEEILYTLYLDSIKIYSIKEVKEDIQLKNMTTFYLNIFLKDNGKMIYGDKFEYNVNLYINDIIRILYPDSLDMCSIKEIKHYIDLDFMTTFYAGIFLEDSSKMIYNDEYEYNVRLNIDDLVKMIYSDMVYGVEKITSEDEQINLDFYYKLIENWYESENIYMKDKNKKLSNIYPYSDINIRAIDKFYNIEHIKYKAKVNMRERLKIEYE